MLSLSLALHLDSLLLRLLLRAFRGYLVLLLLHSTTIVQEEVVSTSLQVSK